MKILVLRFLIAYRRQFMLAAFGILLATIALPMMGCGIPAWLTDAQSVIGVIGASFTSIASFIAALTGNAALSAALAVVSAWITKVQTGVSDLEELITQYQDSPSTGLLANIESALADLQANVVQDFSNLGLPSSVLNVISGIAGLVDGLLTKWSAAISGVKTAASPSHFKAATAHMTFLAESLPDDIAQLKAGVNGYLTAKTGDAEVDAALAATPKL